jgi:hypothetical protein
MTLVYLGVILGTSYCKVDSTVGEPNQLTTTYAQSRPCGRCTLSLVGIHNCVPLACWDSLPFFDLAEESEYMVANRQWSWRP